MTAIVEVHGREILDSRVILPSRWTSCCNRAAAAERRYRRVHRPERAKLAANARYLGRVALRRDICGDSGRR